jgi:hypothetical protein
MHLRSRLSIVLARLPIAMPLHDLLNSSGVLTGGLVGVQTPPPHDRTDENFQHRI